MLRYHPGYAMHHIQAGLTARTPWGWRPAVLTAVDGGHGTAEYFQEHGTVAFWHHKPLDVEPGTPVRVHEQFSVLEISDAWLNVRIDAGVGAVPEPEDPSLWAAEVGGAITNAATGDAMRISPEVFRRLRSRDH